MEVLISARQQFKFVNAMATVNMLQVSQFPTMSYDPGTYMR